MPFECKPVTLGLQVQILTTRSHQIICSCNSETCSPSHPSADCRDLFASVSNHSKHAYTSLTSLSLSVLKQQGKLVCPLTHLPPSPVGLLLRLHLQQQRDGEGGDAACRQPPRRALTQAAPGPRHGTGRPPPLPARKAGVPQLHGQPLLHAGHR